MPFVDFIDQMYDFAVAQYGQPLTTFLFDKRYLLPLEHVPGAVLKECEEHLEPWRIPDLQAAGWFIPLHGAGANSDQDGLPLYVPSRIGLFLELERRGWGPEELRDFARHEENLIDQVLTSEELSYEDDDQALLVRRAFEELQQLEDERIYRLPEDERPKGWWGSGRSSTTMAMDTVTLEAAITKQRHVHGRLGDIPWTRRSPESREQLARHAHRIRILDETIRVSMLNQDREQVRAGFSRAIQFTGQYNIFGPFTTDHRTICWPLTLRDPWGAEAVEDMVLRLPGVILRGSSMTMTPMLTPAAYAERWDQYALAEYLHLCRQVQHERCCLHCQTPLPPAGVGTKRYCDENCRNAARQRRYRANRKRQILRRSPRGTPGTHPGDLVV
jgi:hypothetical protein